MFHKTIAVVTGATSGIGKAIAVELANKGCSVAAIGRSQCDDELLSLLRSKNGDGFQYDITKKNAPKEAFKDIKNKLGGAPTILVNNAGICKDNFFLNLDEEDWTDVIDLNLKAPFIMSQVFARDLIKNPPGDDTYPTIINIGSLSGKIGHMGQSNYAASKAGLVGLTKSLAIELANFNIRANVLVPGFVNTEMTKKIPEKIHNYIISETPLNKMCEASDIADAVTYLSSKHSKFVTGAVIEVTGGLKM